MYLYWTRTDSHTGTYSTKGSVCVDSQRKEVMGQSPLSHHSQTYTVNGCDDKVQSNDSLGSPSVLTDVFLVSAIPMFARKASQPSSLKTSNCLLLARLLSTRGHPLSSCKKGTRINKMCDEKVLQ